MKDLVLTRYYLPDMTLGVLTGDDGLDLVTMEQPWRHNKPFHSCIPEGTYLVIRDSRPSHKRTFCLISKQNGVARYAARDMRDSILIHVGNKVTDIEGCIAPGQSFGTKSPATGYSTDGENVVLSSANAFRELDKYIGDDDSFRIIIRQYKPEPWR